MPGQVKKIRSPFTDETTTNKENLHDGRLVL
jgi:hypothetical protein